MHGSSTLKWAQTQLCRPSGYWVVLFLVLYSRVLRYRALQPSSVRWEEHTYCATSLHEVSCVTVTEHRCPVILFALLHWVGTALADSFNRKKKYIWPLPHPYPPCKRYDWPSVMTDIYTPRVTQLLKLYKL